MKFSIVLLSSIYALTSLGALTIDDVKMKGLASSPHSVQVGSISKRDVPAEIEGVADSNSIPIEDQRIAGDSLASVGSTGKITDVTSTTTKTTTEERVVADDDSSELSKTNDETDSKSKSPFIMAISMIVVSEIGDKTFLISALMAMRHSRILVFTASFASLAIMTILSGIVGHALPTLISQRVTQFLASGLFIVFGIKLTREGLAMSKDLGVDEELAEVEEELEVTDMNHEMNDMESGGNRQRRPSNPNMEREAKLINTIMSHFRAACGLLLDPVWIQVFIMVFLGEWGDRSQIATIAMAAGSDYWGVIMGAIIGHGLCTAAAVVGGKMLASRISMRTVTLGGAFAFFVFSVLYFIEAWNHEA